MVNLRIISVLYLQQLLFILALLSLRFEEGMSDQFFCADFGGENGGTIAVMNLVFVKRIWKGNIVIIKYMHKSHCLSLNFF